MISTAHTSGQKDPRSLTPPSMSRRTLKMDKDHKDGPLITCIHLGLRSMVLIDIIPQRILVSIISSAGDLDASGRDQMSQGPSFSSSRVTTRSTQWPRGYCCLRSPGVNIHVTGNAPSLELMTRVQFPVSGGPLAIHTPSFIGSRSLPPKRQGSEVDPGVYLAELLGG